jgi:hypothetical protein
VENYFNYFTEIEEHFQRARGSGAFRLSPLDWALIEVWKDAEIPLATVLRGIDLSFEKWHKRKRGPRQVNGLAYCTQEVLAAAQQAAPQKDPRHAAGAEQPFAPAELVRHFAKCAEKVRGPFPQIAASLDDLRQAAESGAFTDLEEVERRLTVLEEKIFAGLISSAGEEQMLAVRRDMDAQLAAHRRKMPAEHLAMVERQFIHKKLLEQAGLPRLSLFYL